tara:strand:+ start:3859 stop:4239 length:381 start_codon:yes stop_codon:yes gene_type:complete
MFMTTGMRFAFIIMGLGVATLWGCYTLKVEDAFNQKFSSFENNRIINDYCQSCHIHRDFNPGKHVLAMRAKYRRTLYRKTSECHVCHYVKPILGREELARKTRHPRDVERGRFRRFEKEELRRIKK